MGESDVYKYLGVLEASKRLCEGMKTKITREYFLRVKKVLKSNLNGKSNIDSIDAQAFSLFTYSATFIKWTRDTLTVKKELIAIDDFVEDNIDCVDDIEYYIIHSMERLLVAARRGKGDVVESNKQFKKRKKLERERQIYRKELHRHHFLETNDLATQESWKCSQKKLLNKK